MEESSYAETTKRKSVLLNELDSISASLLALDKAVEVLIIRTQPLSREQSSVDENYSDEERDVDVDRSSEITRSFRGIKSRIMAATKRLQDLEERLEV